MDNATGFTDAFTHPRNGAPCKDGLGLLNVTLAEALNPGLSKMAAASSTHSFAQLARLSNWHFESEAINQALVISLWHLDGRRAERGSGYANLPQNYRRTKPSHGPLQCARSRSFRGGIIGDEWKATGTRYGNEDDSRAHQGMPTTMLTSDISARDRAREDQRLSS